MWDIVKVPFPYPHRPVRQLRLGLVVGKSGGSLAPELLWVVMITSAQNSEWPGDIAIADRQGAGLPAPTQRGAVAAAMRLSLDALLAEQADG